MNLHPQAGFPAPPLKKALAYSVHPYLYILCRWPAWNSSQHLSPFPLSGKSKDLAGNFSQVIFYQLHQNMHGSFYQPRI
jgi:hypothetical protein